VIVVCGSLEPDGRREGLAVAIAGRAAAAGGTVQLVGIVTDGAAGDSRLIAFAASGIGHAAVLRTTPRALEREDVELALRYLPDIRVVVAFAVAAPLIPALVDGAGYAGATLVIILGGVAGDTDPGEAAGLPPTAVVLRAPADDPDATFAGFVGAFAAAIDGGAVPADAWAATLRDLSVDLVRPGPGLRDRASASKRPPAGPGPAR
jgi:hypothetical protein